MPITANDSDSESQAELEGSLAKLLPKAKYESRDHDNEFLTIRY